MPEKDIVEALDRQTAALKELLVATANMWEMLALLLQHLPPTTTKDPAGAIVIQGSEGAGPFPVPSPKAAEKLFNDLDFSPVEKDAAIQAYNEWTVDHPGTSPYNCWDDMPPAIQQQALGLIGWRHL